MISNVLSSIALTPNLSNGAFPELTSWKLAISANKNDEPEPVLGSAVLLIPYSKSFAVNGWPSSHFKPSRNVNV